MITTRVCESHINIDRILYRFHGMGEFDGEEFWISETYLLQ